MAPKKADSGVIIITKDETKRPSEQIVVEDRFKAINGLVQPRHDPEGLIYAYDESFTVGGISDRFATTAASGWIFPEGFSEESKKALESIDLEYLFTSLFVTGNVYFEKIHTLGSEKKIARFEPFITSEVRISRNNGEKIYNQVTYHGNDPKKFEEKKVLHIKLKSLGSKYYGDSKFNRCIRQVVLLGFIDKFYESLFDGGFFGSSIIYDETGKISEPQRNAIAAAIKDKLRGDKNAFTTMVVTGKLGKIDLNKDFDTEAFLSYRNDLIQSIAIALNIPFDLLIPEGSARATKQSSIEEFNNAIVAPIQRRVFQQILEQISEEEIAGISDCSFVPIDTANQKEEMEVSTGYKDSGILTANEVRRKLGEDDHPDGDKLEMKNKKDSPPIGEANSQNKDLQKIEDRIEKMYSNYE